MATRRSGLLILYNQKNPLLGVSGWSRQRGAWQGAKFAYEKRMEESGAKNPIRPIAARFVPPAGEA